MSRRVVAIIAAVGIVASVPLIASAVGPDAKERVVNVERQTYTRRIKDRITTGKGFSIIPGLAHLRILKRGPISVSFNGVVTGAPAQLRIETLDGDILSPRRLTVDPAKDKNVSFTFVGAGGGGKECELVSLKWRSPTGSETRLRYGNLIVNHSYAPKIDGQPQVCPD